MGIKQRTNFNNTRWLPIDKNNVFHSTNLAWNALTIWSMVSHWQITATMVWTTCSSIQTPKTLRLPTLTRNPKIAKKFMRQLHIKLLTSSPSHKNNMASWTYWIIETHSCNIKIKIPCNQPLSSYCATRAWSLSTTKLERSGTRDTINLILASSQTHPQVSHSPKLTPFGQRHICASNQST